MITFDEFVLKLHSQLAKHHPEINISVESVQKALSQVGLIEVMQQETLQISNTNKLFLRRLRISGRRQKPDRRSNESIPFCYDRLFQHGVNGWVAGNGAGKSTILKAIVWGLTGQQQHFKQDIQAWIEDIALEVIIANDVYTIRYYPRLEQPRVYGLIAMSDLDTLLHEGNDPNIITRFSDSSEMMEAIEHFFSEKMKFTHLNQEDSEDSQQDIDLKKISWSVFSQALFIGEDYTDYLFPKGNLNGRPHQKTLSLFLGIGSMEVLAKLELERDQAREEYKFESKRVIINAQGALGKIKDLEVELRSLNERIKAIDEGQSVLVDPAYINTVRENIALHTSKVAELSLSLQDILQEEREIQQGLDDALRMCQVLRETIQFKTFFGGLIVERCPHCEHEISAKRIEKEMQEKHCPLCQNELRPVVLVDQYETMLEESTKKGQKLEQELKAIKKDIPKVVKARKGVEIELVRWREELQDLPRQERIGFTQEMRELVDRRGYLTGQLKQLQEQTEGTHSDRLKNLKDTQDIFEEALTEMQAFIWGHYARHWRVLEERTTELAKLFGVKDLELVSFRLGDRFDLTVRQGSRPIRFRDMEASEKLRLKLAFHLALLMMRITDGIGQHPGLLIIDAPGGAEMDEVHFHNILQGMSSINKQLGDDVQILIASTRQAIITIGEVERFERYGQNEAIF